MTDCYGYLSHELGGAASGMPGSVGCSLRLRSRNAGCSLRYRSSRHQDVRLGFSGGDEAEPFVESPGEIDLQDL